MLLGIPALIIWLITPDSIRYPALYSWKYSVPFSSVNTDRRPTDCEWSHAPIGDKDCHYEKEVQPVRNQQGAITDVNDSGAKVDIPPPPSGPAGVITPANPYAGIAEKADPFAAVARPLGPIHPIHVEVYMPDGELQDFVGRSPEEIGGAWDAAMHKQNVRRWLLSPVVAILVTLAVSYLLQSLNRVLIYVVYGPQKRVAN